jgi:hypothetical protein
VGHAQNAVHQCKQTVGQVTNVYSKLKQLKSGELFPISPLKKQA